jgi:transcriptional regulator with XRE-family HTH domain
VHFRRQIVPVIHTDYLSMYPTACTLMGLWDFVRANGVTYSDDTLAIRELIANPREALVDRLRRKNGWAGLTALVQVLQERNLFPVRAQYPESETATIGLNYLSADKPLWFTLADVLASKVLTGKTPKVLEAVRFKASGKQDGLRPIAVEGQTIDPATDDFYQGLIIHRNSLKAKHRAAKEADKLALKSAEQGVKILANATSYGIFVELNVEDYVAPQPMIGYGVRAQAFKFKSKKFEKPGRYFHPLLGTLITGAARLMLALAEHQVIEQKLDWAFCDTDSIAIANASNLSLPEFKERAVRIRHWFKDLNPYGEDRSILQVEKVNFPNDREDDLDALDPPFCLAVSAKRYALFNRQGSLLIRKASGHGLGHLLAPYDEPPLDRRERIERIGVPLWQEDLWKEVIRAAETDTPDQTRFMDMSGFDVPAASQYAATTPELLAWFKGYNERYPEGERIFPFGFLLSLQAKSRLEIAKDDPKALSHELWRRREPRPAAPYFKRAIDAKDHAFDRDRGDKVPASWLKSHGRSLVRYHLHQETKFWGGEYDQRGPLRGRHVFALTHVPIGKESDQIEENEYIGEEAGPLEHPLIAKDRTALLAFIAETKKLRKITDRLLLGRAGVSAHTLRKLRKGLSVSDKSLFQLVRAAEQLRQETESIEAVNERWLQKLREILALAGSQNKLAKLLGVSRPYLGRVLSGEKPITAGMIERQGCRALAH